MRNIIKTILIAAVSLSITACGPEKGKSIDQMKNLTTADSILYFYGQIRSHEYDKMAIRDTTLNGIEARKRYLDGLRKGFELVSKTDPSYNLGLKDGIDLAIRNNNFQEEFEIKSNSKILMQSMAYGILENDTISPLNAQTNFYNAVHNMNSKRVHEKLAEIHHDLAMEAEIRDMSKLDELLYKRVIEGGEGAEIRYGSHVDVYIRYAAQRGNDLGIPSPRNLVIDNQLPGVLAPMLLSMRDGEIASFATSAYTMFGNRIHSLGLSPKDIVFATITINSVQNPTKQAEPNDTITGKTSADKTVSAK